MSRAAMTGVLCANGENVTFVATDAHKLVDIAALMPKADITSFILPKKPLPSSKISFHHVRMKR